eukprot:CAMPEP_0194348330 /NCGR_PEP_ID=MMETSP0171-20130528/106477_1 /TAXON_ID=218684 /ORGANISM="Corethron pennatum, Strain L29A3" /LENGTH=270 /DNA_ID=CAMNT_0039115665 /DNA_START=173 /DNA_END=982 /DNA_ORIENTATION=+
MSARSCDKAPGQVTSPFSRLSDLPAGMDFSMVIPGAFFCAAAISWYDPSKAAGLFFLFFGLAFVWADDLITSSRGTASRHISDGITLSLVEFANDPERSGDLIAALSETLQVALTNEKLTSERSGDLIAALSETLQVALTNEKLTSTFKEVVIGSFRDEQLQMDILDTFSSAMIGASKNDNFNRALHHAIGKGMSDALGNKEFMEASFAALVDALVAASQNDALRETMLNVVSQSVSDAVSDQRFMTELKGAIKECLKDSDIFRAGAAGF